MNMRCISVVHLSTMLDSSTLVGGWSVIGTYDAFSLMLAGVFCNLQIDGWLGGASGPGDAGSDFSC